MKKTMKKPAMMKRPASKKKPAGAFFMPIAPKKGRQLQVFRRPTSRPHEYSKRDCIARVRRERLPADTAGVGATEWSDTRLAARLVKMKLLPVVKICPKCGCQVEPKRSKDKFGLRMSRCTSTTCRLRISRVTHHAFFKSGSGKALTLAAQWQLLRGMMLHQTQVSIHLSTGVPHATVERFAKRVRGHVQSFVLERQKSIKYGEPGRIVEVEADEVTIC
eukprot:4917597-Amphidinium_carterae.2